MTATLGMSMSLTGIATGGAAAFVWTPTVDGIAATSGNTVFTKTAATTAWDTAAYDPTLTSGNFMIEVLVAPDQLVSFGISDDPSASVGYSDLDLAIYLNGSGDVFQYPSFTNLGAFASGDTLIVRRVGTTGTIEKRAGGTGTPTVLATVTLPAGSYAFDSSIYVQGNSFTVVYYGAV